nr:hypothetical protein [Bradyrhizobium sp. SRL28]
MKLVERPSCSLAASTVFVGRNRRGNWVAREQNGTFGGLFVNRAQAFKYALLENGHHPETIIEVPGEIELDIPDKPNAPRAWPDMSARLRRVKWLSFAPRSQGARSPYHHAIIQIACVIIKGSENMESTS